MKSAVENLGPTRAKLTVEVPFDELEPSLAAAYKKIAQQINVPGFRRGKVPPPVIDRQVGRGAVLDQAVSDALPQLYVEAMRANDLSPLAQPEIDITRFADHEPLEFTAEVDVRPEITLPPYDDLHVTVADATVTDEDVEEQVTHLRERFASLVDVDRPAGEGDFVVMDLVARSDGATVEGAEATQMSYEVGSGGMIRGLDQALVGMAAGDSRTFPSQLLAGAAQGQDVEVEVTVGAVKEQVLPDLDEDFAQMASEFDTVEELTENVRTELANGRRLQQAAEARDAVVQALLDLVDVPLPETVVASELEARRQNLQQRLAFAGTTMEGYLDSQQLTIDELEADLEKGARDAVARQLVLDAVAKAQAIGVDQNELTEHMLRRAQQSGENPNDFIKHMVEHDHVPELVAEVMQGKALASVVESATVTDASGRVVDLKNLRPDGTLGPTGDQPTRDQPAGDQPAGDQPAGERPADNPLAEGGAAAGAEPRQESDESAPAQA